MSLTSLVYLFYLSIVFIFYWHSKGRLRLVFLLLFNLLFYSLISLKFIVWLLLLVLMGYVCGLYCKSKSKSVLFISTILLLLPLAIFKDGNLLLGMFSVNTSLVIIMPVGISFYTFTAISYVVDVWKGRLEPIKDIILFSASMTFFPVILSGPITRIKDISSQLDTPQPFDYVLATKGSKLLLWGVFKKLVLADTINLYTRPVFDHVNAYKGFAIIIAAILYSIQIYADFSGYSDIAIGSANLLGINIPKNFRNPYFSLSFKEFWSRWHISLSTWFRDYVYIPLGGNRVNSIRTNINLLITFLLSGLWHGSGFHYLLWGLLHGILQIAEKKFFKQKSNSKRFHFSGLIQICIMFIAITITWLLFRCNTVSDIVYLFKNMFVGILSPLNYISRGFANLGMGKDKYFILLFVIILITHDYIDEKHGFDLFLSKQNVIIRWILYIGFTLFVIFMLPTQLNNDFIYFQF